MADEIVLDIKVDTAQVAAKLGDATNQVRMLKQEQKLLDKALADGRISQENYGRAIAENKSELEKANREVKSSTALLQAETMSRVKDTASLDEQRQALNAAQKAYGLLSGDAKEAADAEGGLRDQIKALSDSVKAQEGAIGDARRNVGNYSDSILDAAGKMGGFGSGITGIISPLKNATGAMKAMAATPLIAILSIAITILQKLGERFKGNAAAMEKLTGVFGVFSGIGNVVNKIVDKIADGLGWIAQKALALAEKLGILTDSMKAGKEIAEEDLAIQKEQQKVALENAESQKKIAQLRADAAEKDKLTAKQRIDLLQQASDEEEKISQRAYDLAKREYELQVKKNAQSASSQDDLKKENDLKIAMINAETALFNKQRELNSQMAVLRQKVADESKAQADAARKAEMDAQIQYMEDMRTLAVADAATAAAKAAELKKQSEELLASLNEDEDVDESEPLSVEDQVRKMYGLDEEGVAYFMQLYESGTSFAEAKQAALADQLQRNVATYAKSFGQLGNTFSQLGDAIGSVAGETEEAQKAQKAFAFAGILMNQAQSISEGALAIAKGVESASAVPFPGNIPAIISVVAQIGTMIAGVMSSIGQAKQIFAQADSQKFATGGIVGGTSYTGDNVAARLNSGEMVLNKEQQTRLFDAVNGSSDSTLGINYDMMAAAMANVPAPVLGLRELADAQDRVSTIKEIAAI